MKRNVARGGGRSAEWRVLHLLTEAYSPMSPTDIARATSTHPRRTMGLSRYQVSYALYNLEQRGQVVRIAYGAWVAA